MAGKRSLEGLRDQLAEICDSFLDEAMEYNDIPGIALGVIYGDEIFTGARGCRDVNAGAQGCRDVNAGARGCRDVNAGVQLLKPEQTGQHPTKQHHQMTRQNQMQPDDIFHCASVSKLFTSAAIMKLYEAKVIDLNDRLCDVLPDLQPADERYRDIRIWQMLSHTSGIGDVDDYHWEEALTGEDALSDYVHSEEVMQMPLLWEPGKGGFRYSNIAYEMLGHIVSVKSAEYMKKIHAAGYGGNGGSADACESIPCDDHCNEIKPLSYDDFIKRFLLEPAGMKDSTMLTFERFGISSGAPCPLITDEIRRLNREHDNEIRRLNREHDRSGCSAAFGQDESGSTSDSGQGGSACPEESAQEVSGRMGGMEQDGSNCYLDPSHGYIPMVLPHEKAEDRSIVPVKYYPYTRSHGPSSTLTSNVGDLLKWAKIHMRGFAEVEEADRKADIKPVDGITGNCAAERKADLQAAAGKAASTSEKTSNGSFAGTCASGSPDGEDLVTAAGSPDREDLVTAAGSPEGERLLTFDSYQHMHYEYAEVPNNREKMGLGWFMRRQGGHQLYGHEGSDDGFRSSLWICPELSLGIVILSNISGAPVKKLSKKLFEKLTSELTF